MPATRDVGHTKKRQEKKGPPTPRVLPAAPKLGAHPPRSVTHPKVLPAAPILVAHPPRSVTHPQPVRSKAWLARKAQRDLHRQQGAVRRAAKVQKKLGPGMAVRGGKQLTTRDITRVQRKKVTQALLAERRYADQADAVRAQAKKLDKEHDTVEVGKGPVKTKVPARLLETDPKKLKAAGFAPPGLADAIIGAPTRAIGNVPKDAYELASTFPSSLAHSVVENVKDPLGIPKRTIAPYNEIRKHPIESIVERPVQTTLALAPFVKVPGLALGRLSRGVTVGSKTVVKPRRSLKRPDIKLEGTAFTEERHGSRDILVRAAQERADRKAHRPPRARKPRKGLARGLPRPRAPVDARLKANERTGVSDQPHWARRTALEQRTDEFADLARHNTSRHAREAEQEVRKRHAKGLSHTQRLKKKATRKKPEREAFEAEVETAVKAATERARHENDAAFVREFGANVRPEVGHAAREAAGRTRKDLEVAKAAGIKKVDAAHQRVKEAKQKVALAKARHVSDDTLKALEKERAVAVRAAREAEQLAARQYREAASAARKLERAPAKSETLTALKAEQRAATRELRTAEVKHADLMAEFGVARGRAQVLSENIGGEKAGRLAESKLVPAGAVQYRGGGRGVEVAGDALQASSRRVEEARARVRTVQQQITSESRTARKGARSQATAALREAREAELGKRDLEPKPIDAKSLEKTYSGLRDEKTGATLENVKVGMFGERMVVRGDIVRDGKKIGNVSRFYDPKSKALIKEITNVDAAHQRQGIASRLAAAEERAVADLGAEKVEVVPGSPAGEALSARVGGWRDAGPDRPGRLVKDLPRPVGRNVRGARAAVRDIDKKVSAERQRIRHEVPPKAAAALKEAVDARTLSKRELTDLRGHLAEAYRIHQDIKGQFREGELIDPDDVGRLFDHKADAAKVLRQLPHEMTLMKVGDQWAAVPKVAHKRLQHHEAVGSGKATGGRILRATSRTFRGAVLALSGPWLLGQFSEAAWRLGVAHGFNPLSVAASMRREGKLYKELEAIETGLGDQLRARAVKGGQFGLTSVLRDFSENTRSLADEFAGSRAEKPMTALTQAGKAPGIRHARGTWKVWQHGVFNVVNGAMEQMTRRAMLGRAVKRGPLMEQRLVGLSDQALKEAAQGLRGTAAQVQLGRAVNQMYGRYSQFSPNAREAMAHWTPFLPWTLNMLNFLTRVMPRDHPITTSLIASQSLAQEEWRKREHVSFYGKDRVPPWLMGTYPQGDNQFTQVGRYIPTAPGDPVQHAAQLIAPQISGSLYPAATGRTWKDKKLESTGAKALESALAGAEAHIPGAAVGLNISGLGDKLRGEEPKEGSALEKLGQRANPFKTIKSHPRAKKKRKKSGGGSSGGFGGGGGGGGFGGGGGGGF